MPAAAARDAGLAISTTAAPGPRNSSGAHLGRALASALWAGSGRGRWVGADRRRRALPWVMLVLGLGIAVAAAGSEFAPDRGVSPTPAFLVMLPGVAAFALVTARPLDAWRLGTLWVLVLPFVLPAPAPGGSPPLEWWAWLLWVPVLLLAAWAAPGLATLGAGIVSALVMAVLCLLTPWPVAASALPLSLLTVVVALGLGAALGARWDARRALEAEQVRRGQAQAERGALAERARIAREMHDVVAHHMSMIAVRCETAPYRLPDLPPAATTELAEVAAAAREALGELQSLLGVLRTGVDDTGPERAPQPGLADVERLFADARSAGAELTWEFSGAPVSDALGLTTFRIVQQSLANAAQHAPGAAVEARVVASAGLLEIDVRNGPGTAAGRPDSGAAGRPDSGAAG
ncbi:sensor histidine kinase, partial [Pseudonocardia ailaonensis]|uniref:sensor histidine kinase n=1 Tax=Pseudonocardia ailaonensis TaxID=367279 RepID=UPI0031E0E044